MARILEGCGLTYFYWAPRRRWLQIGFAALVVLFVAVLQSISLTEGRMGWYNLLGLSWAFVYGPIFFLDRPLYIISHGVLAVARAVRVQQTRVPLRACDILRDQRRWQFRWPEGRRRETAAVPAYPGLLTLIGEGLAESGESPRTRKEAERLVSVAGLVRPSPAATFIVVGFLAAMGLAVWLNQPLFLLPMAAVPLLLPSWSTIGYLVLTPDDLYVATPDAATVRIPRADVTKVANLGREQGVIVTRHPDCSKLAVNRFAATEFLRRLEQGEAAQAPSPVVPKATAAPAVEATLRCSLCGRVVEPGLVGRPGDIHICERCSERARQEAVDSGHGPAGRDPKPM